MTKIILLILISLNVYSYSVALGDVSEPLAYFKTDDGSNYDLVLTGGDAKTKEAAVTIYAPYKLHAGATTGHHKIPDAQMLLAGSTSNTAGLIFDLELVDDSRTDLYLNVAVRKTTDTEYTVVKKNISQETPYLKLKEICAQDTDLNCTDLNDATKGNAIVREAYFYLFYSLDSDTGVNLGDQINPSATSYANGIFYRIYFSNDLQDYASGDTRVKNQRIYRGDSSLYVDYEGIRDDSKVDRIAAFGKMSSASPSADDYYQTFSSAGDSGQVLITKLTNAIEYCFVLRYLDRYGFKSSTDAVIGSNCAFPTEIEKLLAEKSCYFVTAGFGREHFVLEYFRYIRDEYLLANYFGNMFIKAYYSSAPKYAHYIYESSTFSFIVRSVSYALYYILNYFSIFTSALIGVLLLAFRKKQKNGTENIIN